MVDHKMALWGFVLNLQEHVLILKMTFELQEKDKSSLSKL